MTEVLTTLAVVGVVVSNGVPAMQNLVHEQRLTTQVNQLLGDLHLARSESIKRGVPVVLCKSGDGVACSTTTDWQNGWLVFVDSDDDNISGRERTGYPCAAGAQRGCDTALRRLRPRYRALRHVSLDGVGRNKTGHSPSATRAARRTPAPSSSRSPVGRASPVNHQRWPAKLFLKVFLDRADGPSVHYAPFFPGSSAVEQVTVNHWVGGSNPSRGANSTVRVSSSSLHFHAARRVGILLTSPRRRFSACHRS